MESGSWSTSRNRMAKGLLPALTPVVLIAVGYIDPGKWATCMDVGARFGGDLVAFALAFNLVGVFCHYLSARISVVTGKNLSQLCSEEYDKLTCFFLGIEAEASVIFLDLTMILGMAHGLNLIFGLDLFTCIMLTAVNAFLYPLFSVILEICKVKFLVVCMAGVTIFCYVLGMLTSLPEFPVSSNSLLSKLSGESAFALMGLLGANVMPHNFYLHSSIVQRYHGPASVSKGEWLRDYFVISLTISGAMFLVNYVLMNLAAGAFYSTGLGLLTFQDAVSLLDQAYRNPIIPFASFLVLFLANQIVASSWEFCGEGGETVLHDFFNMELPEWLHRATVRIFAVVTALFCLWHSGADGMYHLLICTQVMMALLLPSSLIPLFRIASSRPLMGLHKISPIYEFVVLLTFMGILGLELIFVVEMIFGESDWVGNLRWNIGNATSLSYILLLFAACISLLIMLWLAATPLKSASSRLDSQPWNWDAQEVAPELCSERDNSDVIETRCHDEEPLKDESLPLKERSLRSHPDIPNTTYDVSLPDTIIGSVHETYVTNNSDVPVISARLQHEPEQSATSIQSVPVSNVVTRDSDNSFPSSGTVETESSDLVEKTLRIEGDSQLEKELEEGSILEPEVLSKEVTDVGLAATADGPGSFRSLSGKNDEGGSGVGSLSRLSGLGRAARRQLAAALDEFWSQLYDFHGQITQEAKVKKLDMLLGMDPKPGQSLAKADSAGKEFGMQLQSIGGRLPDNTMNLGLYDSPNHQKLQNNMDSAYGTPRGSASLWSNSTQMQLLDAYMQNSNRSSLDVGERRYQSLHYPASSDRLDNQPATVHGYQLASYLNRMAKEDRFDYAYGQLEPAPQKSPSLIPNNYRESLAFALRQQSANGYNSLQQSSAQTLAVQRNNLLQSDNSYYDVPAGPVERMASQNNAKKYHSSPNISGLSVPLRNMYLSERNAQLDSSNPAMSFGATVGRAAYEQSPYSSAGSRAPAPLAFDELSPSRAYRDAMSLRSSSVADACSLWSRQPFEQFGLANKTSSVGAQVPGNRSGMMTQEPPSVAEMESKLLQSLRHCILKLLKLEGSEWLFRSNDGADEDLIDRVATRERFVYEVESRDFKQVPSLGDPQNVYSERKVSPNMRDDEAVFAHVISSVPNCGEGCVWKADLVVSFGVWCIHRILELSLMESRPELWGKYTYVLNRLQGVIELAFFKPRSAISPCFCLQVPASFQLRASQPVSNGMPPTARAARGKVTTSAMLLETIKDVEIAISCRKGRSGTAAGDVAFPKGKENLASVLKRYKRRLSNKPVGAQDSGPGSRKLYSSPYGS